MKIAYKGLDLPEGKAKYNDKVFKGLVDKFQPAKVSPYYFDWIQGDFERAEIIAVTKDCLLEVLIADMDKIEMRLSRTEDALERAVLQRCLEHVEKELPVCDLELNEAEMAVVKALRPLSFTSTVVYDGPSPDADEVCREGMEKAGKMFFYTVGKQEVHAWLVDKDTDAVTCAGKIHSDLARGFIKAEIVSVEDMMEVHNMQAAREKKMTRLVDRGYVIPRDTILDIRFNV